MLRQMWSVPSERIELLVVAVLVAVILWQLVRLLRQPRSEPGAGTNPSIIVVAFAFVAPVIDLIGVLVSGNSTSRYFVPVFVFPLLALLPLVDRARSPFRSLHPAGGAIVAGCALVATTALFPQLQPMLDPGEFTDGACLQHALHGEPRTGEGDYWTARALTLYSPNGSSVLQVTSTLIPFGWLVNLGSFASRTVTFVLVDRSIGAPVGLVSQDTKVLGPPTSIAVCPGFDVYSYPTGTYGSEHLTAIVNAWYASTVRQRR